MIVSVFQIQQATIVKKKLSERFGMVSMSHPPPESGSWTLTMIWDFFRDNERLIVKKREAVSKSIYKKKKNLKSRLKTFRVEELERISEEPLQTNNKNW